MDEHESEPQREKETSSHSPDAKKEQSKVEDKPVDDRESKRVKVSVKVAIIVPFRDEHVEQKREEQLKKFIPYMTDYLSKEEENSVEFCIFIIEQSQDGRLFNRGKLLNIGYEMAKSRGFNLFIFHDVDLLPNKQLLCQYVNFPSPSTVLHIAAVWKRYSGEQYFGGIVAFRGEDFEKINGFPNDYWGWGGEDDELRRRVNKCKLRIQKITKGELQDLENLELRPKLDYLKSKKLKNNLKWELKDAHISTWRSNGLKNLSFAEIDRKDHGTWIRVKVDLSK